MLSKTYVTARRALVCVLGASVVLVGIMMLVTPGPAIVVIPAGLARLATDSGRLAFEDVDAEPPRQQRLEVLDAAAVRHLAQDVQDVAIRFVA